MARFCRISTKGVMSHQRKFAVHDLLAMIPIKRTSSILKTILLTGLLSGTLDISGAIIDYLLSGGTRPVLIFRYIARAVFGKEAAGAGTLMPALGLFFHYAISYGWTLIFFLLYPRLKLGSKNKFATGLLYGILIWVVMNLVILPLTALPSTPFSVKSSITGILLLMFLMGLPISLFANFYFKKLPGLNRTAGDPENKMA